MIGEVVMDLMQPRLMATIVDDGVRGIHNNGIGDINIIIQTGLLMIGLVLIGGVCGVLSGVFANLCSQNFANDLRTDCFKRVMHFSFEQTDQFSTGSLVTRITNDVTQVQNMIGALIRGFVRTFMLFAGGIFCMLLLDLSFGTVLACALPLVILFVIFFIVKASPKFTVLQKKLDSLNSIMQENVSASRVVKAYVQEEHEQQRFEQANHSLVGTQLYVLKLFSFMSPVTNIVLNLSVVAIIYIGGIGVQAGSGVSTGNIMAAITYISQILMAVLNMANLFQTLSRSRTSSKRLKEVLRTLPALKEGDFSEETAVHGKIEFRNVSFAYPNTNSTILQQLNFTIQPGETIAILGSTGAGKSSLVHLIPRFYDVTSGQILIDNIDVKSYRFDTLRKKISIALQRTELFSTTIAQNISWGKQAAERTEIEKAAKVAQAEDFILSKSEGYDTLVAEKGMSLSGGQKQRLSIARAVLKAAEILILDDATSALDLATEAKLYEGLKNEYPAMTKIIIAQRISSIRHAQRIFVLEQGQIKDVGTHEELLKHSTIYQEIYQSQQRTGGGLCDE